MTDENAFDSVNTIEFYVGSARQWAFMHEHGMGFRFRAYSGPETGVRDRVSYLMEQSSIRMIFTSFLNPSSPIADHMRVHGDGVKDVELAVPNIDYTVKYVEGRGLVKPGKVREQKTENGRIRKAVLPTFGETVHTITDFSEYEGSIPPGFEEVYDRTLDPIGLKKVDHAVGNVEDSLMDKWVDYYVKGLGFDQLMSFDDKDISTKYSALRSKVVHYNDRKIVFPINEPALGMKKSQIQEYLDYYNSPGVQHIALETDDIVKTVSDLKKRGIEFLDTPDIYYDTLNQRVGEIDENVEKLRDLKILVDRDESGYLLQIFTKPTGDRPTFFYEIIQRKGARSFGKGNFKALFESIEVEQARRGNL
ncbi:4-hydroxyphenylpyruvate dioxygenase [uncultured archaeon]|nr:4-hydroxyphenylpyruvate dioxygenase [uncultured archaeon]